MDTSCTLLPGAFGFAVQGVLLVLSLAVLVLKKLREKGERTWLIFALDSSKQIFGAGFVHILNMVTSTILGANMTGDACDWYWMSIMVDTTLGVALEYMWLVVLTRALGNSRDFQFGDYYTEKSGRINRVVYGKQLGLWFCCILGMKIIVLLLLILFLKQMIQAARVFLALVSWNSELKLIFVMVLTPCCMNTLQLWLTDSFIKKDGASCSDCAKLLFYRCIGKEAPTTFYESEDLSDEQGTYLDRPSRRSSKNSVSSSLSEPLMARQGSTAASMEEREALLEGIAHLKGQIDELSMAGARDRREREMAEVRARKIEDELLDAHERLHKSQQELRLYMDAEQLLRDRLAIKEEREQQLLQRVQQLEFSYTQAGAAANAVFAAEVSAASVAAASLASRQRLGANTPSVTGTHTPVPATPAAVESDPVSTIDAFLTGSLDRQPVAKAAPAPLASPTRLFAKSETYNA